MRKLISFLALGTLCLLLVGVTSGKPPAGQYKKQACSTIPECETEAKTYLEQAYEVEASQFCNRAVIGEWNYNTNLTSEEAEEAAAEASIAYSNFQFRAWNDSIRHWDFEAFTDSTIKRQLKFLNVIGVAALNSTDLSRYNQILGEMSKTYGTAKICPFNNQNCNVTSEGLNLEPDVENIISTSRNSAELAYTWEAWRNASGKPIRELYNEFIDLSNKAAQANGLSETSDLWLLRYESEDFKSQVEDIWNGVKPLYQKLYGFARFQLRKWYPQDFVNEDDPIPNHILGNMWSQQWDNIYDIVQPFPNSPGFDITEELQKRFGSSGQAAATEIFKLANKFFTDLGLADMSVSFGDKAVIVRPEDREVVCHASAWDFCDAEDYRIKMCTNIAHDDFLTVHHELGHIQYFMQYSNQPITFREGGNPGFHEAIGDVISLSVATTKHMIKLGLMNNTESNDELTLNYLMKMALEKIAFLPFGYLIDAYRWQLFDGTIPRSNFTQGWLKIRNEVQGLIPPTVRTEQDFDPGSKYHVPGNTPYIRYFVSFILQFQVHKALCLKAGEYVPEDPNYPLHNCDIDGNPEAGAVMKELLQAGASANWQDILEIATGSRTMDASALKEYFAPLERFLDEQQALLNYSTTWRNDAWMEKYSAN
ncbi:unnamed protein product [Orchesella dallaii]|uniref:Angiotensin-converting enzyme n=1 Tax=Orchesella dallaii TaxID=48710 RepID=A0ABP1QDJ1_9HEXA